MNRLIEKEAIHKVINEPANEWYKMKNRQNKDFWNTKSRSEDLAYAILNNDGVSKLFAVKKITRCEKSRSYFIKEHNIINAQKRIDENKKYTLDEVLICNKMFISSAEKSYNFIGKVIDYQTPLRNNGNDKGYKGVDLISYNKHENSLFLLETKKPDTTETLLRAVLEIFTYWKIIDHQKLLYDFSKSERCNNLNLYNTLIKKAVLLFEGSYAYNEYVNNTSPNTIELMNELGVEFYGIRKKYNDYEVFLPKINRTV